MLATPAIAHAYLLPEEVLLSEEFYDPPRSREAGDRARMQAEESAARRAEEWAEEYNAQHPSAPEEPVLEEEAGTTDADLTPEELELLRTIRLLNRVEDQQNVLQSQQGLHGGAPLPPTGAGGILALITMIGAVGWTLFRAQKERAFALTDR